MVAITSLELMTPADAEVFINNKKLANNNSNGEYLESGFPVNQNIEIKLKLSGYETYFKYIKFANSFDSKNIVISKADMSKRHNSQSKNKTGVVQVISIPNNLEFSINGKKQYTSAKFNLLSVGNYVFEFKHNGKVLKKEATFTENGNYVVQADLKNGKLLIAKEITFRTNNSWTSLEIDHKIVSQDANFYKDYFDISKIQEIKAISDGQKIVRDIDFNSNYEDIVFAKMIFVKGGEFTMGSNKSNSDDEKPEHQVIVDDYYISKFEVTQKEWQSIMKTNPSRIIDEQHPVNGVSWIQAVKFCNNKSVIENLDACYTINGLTVECDFTKNGYRLPTEAEWEYASKGGKKSKHYLYSGSNKIDEVAYYALNSDRETHPVGEKKPNELGIYDMSGNVLEWCWDWFGAEYYKESPKNNPKGLDSSRNKVLRGGNYRDVTGRLTNTIRWVGTKSTRRPMIGFRIVKKGK